MKNEHNNILKHFLRAGRFLPLTALLTLTACDDFVKIDPPRTGLVKSTVFSDDATANAAMINVYYSVSSQGFANGGATSISFWGTYSSDEQINYNANPDRQEFNANELLPSNPQILNLWSQLYKTIYDVNAIIEGVNESTKISSSMRMQLEGEAKFIRAFCNFYLVNLFGDVPIVTTTNHQINSNLSRQSVDAVYQQIVSDLIEAQNLLPEDYSLAGDERVRTNKYATTALLARVYLYMGDWTNAEAKASAIISNTELYSLSSSLNGIFMTNSSEAILQWWSEFRPVDRATFRAAATPIYGSLRAEFATSFEPGDSRVTWINLNPSGYYNVRKYNTTNDNPPMEYSTVLRLAEQYLIRAEARTQRDNISGAQEDINVIRHRAGLGDTPASDKASLLLAIEEERKHELFTEWGHRWLDLKRTNRADAILEPIKGNTWQSTDVLYPIPEYQILNTPAMKNAQNPGY